MRTNKYNVLTGKYLTAAVHINEALANHVVKEVADNNKPYLISRPVFEKLHDQEFSQQFSKAFMDGMYEDEGTILVPYDKTSVTYRIKRENGKLGFFLILVGRDKIIGVCNGQIEDDGKIRYEEETLINFTPIINFVFTFVLFKKYVDVETVMLKPKQKTKVNKEKFFNDSPKNVTVIDSTYFRTIIVEGFSVRGHFRWQRYGKGLKQKKLIWIEGFEKKSYVRKATKLN